MSPTAEQAVAEGWWLTHYPRWTVTVVLDKPLGNSTDPELLQLRALFGGQDSLDNFNGVSRELRMVFNSEEVALLWSELAQKTGFRCEMANDAAYIPTNGTQMMLDETGYLSNAMKKAGAEVKTVEPSPDKLESELEFLRNVENLVERIIKAAPRV